MRTGLLIRHLLSVAILPVTVAVVVPAWLMRRDGRTLALAGDAAGLALQALGVVLLAIGLALFASSLRRFAAEGEGTLAPWDPPRRLVLRGPYRFVRNPMISGVIFTLFGEAALLRAAPHVDWAIAFALTNFIYIPLFEEPQLRGRFGEAYVEYCRHVPRFVPRLSPWQGDPVEPQRTQRTALGHD